MAAQSDIAGGTPHQNLKPVLFRHPTALGRIIVGKGTAIEGDGYRLALTRFQKDFLKSFQFLFRPRQARMILVNIQFRDLSPVPGSRVPDDKLRGDQSICAASFKSEYLKVV